jgi:hypothetical protein
MSWIRALKCGMNKNNYHENAWCVPEKGIEEYNQAINAKLKSCLVYVSSFTLQKPTIIPLQKLKSAVLKHYCTLLRVTTYLFHESY